MAVHLAEGDFPDHLETQHDHTTSNGRLVSASKAEGLAGFAILKRIVAFAWEGRMRIPPRNNRE